MRKSLFIACLALPLLLGVPAAHGDLGNVGDGSSVVIGPYAHFGDTTFLGTIEGSDITVEGDIGGTGYNAPLFDHTGTEVNLEGAGTITEQYDPSDFG